MDRRGGALSNVRAMLPIGCVDLPSIMARCNCNERPQAYPERIKGEDAGVYPKAPTGNKEFLRRLLPRLDVCLDLKSRP